VRFPGQSRPIAIWLVFIAALLLRAGVPSGWMPVASAGGLQVMLCSGTGPVAITLDPGAGHREDQPGNGGVRHDPCPYGLALGLSLDLPAAIVLELPPQASAALFAPMLAVARLTARRGLRPPARGPPAFA